MAEIQAVNHMAEINEMLGLTEDILQMIKQMHANGESVDSILWFLHEAGTSKPGAIIALRRTAVMPIRKTKLTVHLHPAYAYRRITDEMFEEEAAHLLALPSEGTEIRDKAA